MGLRLVFKIVLILFIPLGIAAVTYFFMRFAFLEPLDPASNSKEIVEIAPKRTCNDVSRELVEKHIIRYSWSFNILAKLLKADKRMKAGEYEVTGSMTPRQVIEKLMSGDVIKRLVTVVPGSTIRDVPGVVESQGLMPADEFAKALRDPGLLVRAGLSAQSFEGYLYPETYQFSRPIVPWEIILRMITEGENHWPQDFSTRADELKMSRHEVLTLASIIEKESGVVDEQPIISSVFHNRLKRGMKLQSDPTVIYGLQNYNGNITEEDLKNPHAYNTYVNFGLPPGPIANASLNAIKAALYPADTTYLFFVADGTGRHVFSTTYQEHQEAVARWVKIQAARGGSAPAPAAATAPPASPGG